MAAQLLCNEKVGGSSPLISLGAGISKSLCRLMHGRTCSKGASDTCNIAVRSSILLASIMYADSNGDENTLIRCPREVQFLLHTL